MSDKHAHFLRHIKGTTFCFSFQLAKKRIKHAAKSAKWASKKRVMCYVGCNYWRRQRRREWKKGDHERFHHQGNLFAYIFKLTVWNVQSRKGDECNVEKVWEKGRKIGSCKSGRWKSRSCAWLLIILLWRSVYARTRTRQWRQRFTTWQIKCDNEKSSYILIIVYSGK